MDSFYQNLNNLNYFKFNSPLPGQMSGESHKERRKTVTFNDSPSHVRVFHELEVVARVHISPSTKQSMSKHVHHVISFWGLPRGRRAHQSPTGSAGNSKLELSQSQSGDLIHQIILEEINVSQKKMALQGLVRIRKSDEGLPNSFSFTCSVDDGNTRQEIVAHSKTVESINEESDPDTPRNVKKYQMYAFEVPIGAESQFLNGLIRQMDDLLSANQDLLSKPCTIFCGEVLFEIPMSGLEWKFPCHLARISVAGEPSEKTLLEMIDEGVKLNQDIELSSTESSEDFSRTASMDELAMATDEAFESMDTSVFNLGTNMFSSNKGNQESQDQEMQSPSSPSVKTSLYGFSFPSSRDYHV